MEQVLVNGLSAGTDHVVELAVAHNEGLPHAETEEAVRVRAEEEAPGHVWVVGGLLAVKVAHVLLSDQVLVDEGLVVAIRLLVVIENEVAREVGAELSTQVPTNIGLEPPVASRSVTLPAAIN